MSSRTIVIIITAVVVLFTALSLRSYFSQKPPEQAQAPTAPRILVAKRNLSSGSFIQVMTDLDWQPEAGSENAKPEEQAKEGGAQGEGEKSAEKLSETNAASGEANANKAKYIYENNSKIDSFAGAVVRRSIMAGEPILANDLVKSGDGGFLSAVLGEGKRAISIAVNITSGNAGFISPGDKVDLLLTHRIQGEGKNEKIITETFARNVRVLAVDQILENPENKAIVAKTVTVEVTPEQAEQVSIAAEIGKISMSLVSSAIANQVDEASTASAGEATKQEGTLDGISKVRVIRGDRIETLEFYQR